MNVGQAFVPFYLDDSVLNILFQRRKVLFQLFQRRVQYGKAKKHSRSKKDIYASIAVQFSERFDSEEHPVALGETQLKNKIETMYRVFYQEEIYFTSTSNGDIVGPQTRDDIVVRHSTTSVSSQRPLTSAKARAIQRDVDDDNNGDSYFDDIDNEDGDDVENSEDDDETGDGDGGDGHHGHAASTSADSAKKPRKPKGHPRSAGMKNKDKLPPEMWAIMNIIREQSQATKDIETRRLILEEKKQTTDEKRHVAEEKRQAG
ncbi:hypothetical protein BG011_005779 [Mortierella polycephala]|uniref:Uncharacterized protein n=1 Tax=Mortierella polycephala TaxID=41804 RepID=A0A9P6PWF8_9FUNG|nr:hypothetical protein BG011_005779 [Mortierella polycephala]